MPRTRLIWQLFPPFLFILLLAVGGTALCSALALDALYQRQIASQLEREARLIREEFAGALATGDIAGVDAQAKALAKAGGARVTVVLPTGRVVGDSEAAPASMDNHGDRPEVREALAGRVGHSVRFSFTTRTRRAYVALPIEQDGKAVGVLRLSLTSGAVAEAIEPFYLYILAGAGAIAALAVLASYLASRRVTRQLESIRAGAGRYARGELETRLLVSDTEELGAIAEAMNAMGGQLQERMGTVLRQRNELEGVLSSMVEGVLAFDTDERVINLNRAAAVLLQLNPVDVRGRTLQEVVRNTDIQRFVGLTLSSREPIEGDVTLYHEGERVLQAHGTVLRDGNGRSIGGLLVLNDVTRLRRLENARRDFVANVSHELRTPITSIKGYVETLLDGALDNREDAVRFLNIIENQAERLNALIGDLLTLSRIEEETESDEPIFEHAAVSDVLERAVEACRASAAGKDVRVELACEAEAAALMNAALVEQAVVNLLDNAIKYSEPGREVRVEGSMNNGEAVVRVIDQGCGIEADHLPRLFERFYRVDKARSRKLGGTGLGLAIVKHIVRMHGGRTGVDSTPGVGSTFSIYLPTKR